MTSCIVTDLFTLYVIFLFRVFDHQLITSCSSPLLPSGTDGNCYEYENRFTDRVGNGNEICNKCQWDWDGELLDGK